MVYSTVKKCLTEILKTFGDNIFLWLFKKCSPHEMNGSVNSNNTLEFFKISPFDNLNFSSLDQIVNVKENKICKGFDSIHK